jgi:hypothetical protein
MKGFKTVAFGVVIAIAPAAIAYLGGVDWTALGISPPVAALIGSAIVALRAVTNTAIGQK